MAKTYYKDPGDVLDYVNDWSDWLDGDTLDTSTFTVESGLTKDSESNASETATVWLSGGTLGERYEVLNEIVTAAGRSSGRIFYVVMRARSN